MNGMTWNRDWETGIRLIDEQHRHLFLEMGLLGSALERERDEAEAAAEASRALALVLEYVDFHFETEEHFMKKTGYARIAEHRAEHDRLRQDARALTLGPDRPMALEADQVMGFLYGWLANHLSTLDQDLAAHLRAVFPLLDPEKLARVP